MSAVAVRFRHTIQKASKPFVQPGEVGPVPKIVLNTVRVPLTAFSSVNLNNIRSVQFTFAERFQGAVLIADIAFASAPR